MQSFKFSFSGIYPLHDVHIRKVKVMKRPRFDLNKLMDMHGEGSGELNQSIANIEHPLDLTELNLQVKPL